MGTVSFHRAIYGYATLEVAKEMASLIDAPHVEIVALHLSPEPFKMALKPVGYFIVPSQHDCPVCDHPVIDPMQPLTEVHS